MKTILSMVFLCSGIALMAADLDSLIVECKITDKETGAPVVARVKYESQPYGSKLGIRTDSTIQIRVDFEEKYTVRVEATGYETQVFDLDFTTYAGATHVVKPVAMSRGLEEGALMRLQSLNFAQASAFITREAFAELDNLVETMKNNPDMIIQLEGHTDFNGDPRANMKLSEERVEATRDYMVAKGIDKSRILVEAFGGERPLSRSNTPEAHAMNRRVEVRVIKK